MGDDIMVPLWFLMLSVGAVSSPLMVAVVALYARQKFTEDRNFEIRIEELQTTHEGNIAMKELADAIYDRVP